MIQPTVIALFGLAMGSEFSLQTQALFLAVMTVGSTISAWIIYVRLDDSSGFLIVNPWHFSCVAAGLGLARMNHVTQCWEKIAFTLDANPPADNLKTALGYPVARRATPRPRPPQAAAPCTPAEVAPSLPPSAPGSPAGAMPNDDDRKVLTLRLFAAVGRGSLEEVHQLNTAGADIRCRSVPSPPRP